MAVLITSGQLFPAQLRTEEGFLQKKQEHSLSLMPQEPHFMISFTLIEKDNLHSLIITVWAK